MRQQRPLLFLSFQQFTETHVLCENYQLLDSNSGSKVLKATNVPIVPEILIIVIVLLWVDDVYVCQMSGAKI